MTDNDFLLRTLEDGYWHSHSEILAWSFAERGCGLTIHSRAADLRKKGHVLQVELRRESGRALSFYRLVGRLDETAASPSALRGGGSGSRFSAAVSSSAPSIPAQPLPFEAPTEVHAEGRGGGVLTLFQEETP